MFPLVMLGRLMAAPLMKLGAGVAKGGSALAEGAAKSAKTNAESDNVREIESKSNSSINTDGAPVDFDDSGDSGGSKEPDMFGGLDLANIKSVIDGPMGPLEPEEEVKGGVYKQIFAVNKSMLASLLRMEETMRMLLSIEYERIQGMVQQSTEDSISGSKKEIPPEEKQGLFGRAVGGIKSGYGKAKSAMSGGLGKFIGLGALVIGFKFFRKEIDAAMAKVFEIFKNVYDYFTDPEFTLAKFGDDIMAGLKTIVSGAMDFIMTAVKEVVLGPGESKSIQIQTDKGLLNKKNLESSAISGSSEIFNAAMTTAGVDVNSDEYSTIRGQLQDTAIAMQQISSKSDGRIQWSTYNGDARVLGPEKIFVLPVSTFENANPVIDGVPYPNWDVLKDINLDDIGGITRLMDENRQDAIRDKLAEKSAAYQAMAFADEGADKIAAAAEFSKIEAELSTMGQQFIPKYSAAEIKKLQVTPKEQLVPATSYMHQPANIINNVSSTKGGDSINNGSVTQLALDAKNNYVDQTALMA